MDNALLAGLIRLESKRVGVPIAKILKECGIRKSLVYDLEKRDYTPSGEVLLKLADYFDCSVDYLLGRTDRRDVNR